jgi:hypothetical protein
VFARYLITSQKPLWNRGFEHFDNLARSYARAAVKNRDDVAPPLACAQQVV